MFSVTTSSCSSRSVGQPVSLAYQTLTWPHMSVYMWDCEVCTCAQCSICIYSAAYVYTVQHTYVRAYIHSYVLFMIPHAVTLTCTYVLYLLVY